MMNTKRNDRECTARDKRGRVIAPRYEQYLCRQIETFHLHVSGITSLSSRRAATFMKLLHLNSANIANLIFFVFLVSESYLISSDIPKKNSHLCDAGINFSCYRTSPRLRAVVKKRSNVLFLSDYFDSVF